MKEVVPILESENLNYHFYIVGKNPSLEIEKLSEKYKEKITITGYVDSIDEYYDKTISKHIPNEHTPLLDILCVEFYDFLEIGDFAAAADLPHAGYAGFGSEAGTVVKVILFNFVLRWGTCA